MKSIAYEGGVLEIQWNNGKTYRYEASPEAFQGLAAAESKGKFFGQNRSQFKEIRG
jgi:hypothetical protein